MEILSRF